jgi:hypothetical protein
MQAYTYLKNGPVGFESGLELNRKEKIKDISI